MIEHDVSWFAGVLVTRSSSDRAGHVPLFEESFVLVTAVDREEALRKIAALGADECGPYLVAGGAHVSWELVHILDVQQLRTPPEDGATAYARHFRDYGAYRRFEPLLDGSVE